MNYIEIGIWAVTGLALLLGLILGAIRGSRRAVLRLVLILVCVLVAFFLKDLLTDKVLGTAITNSDGTTLTVQELIVSSLPEEMRELGDAVVVPLVRVIIGIVLFLSAFLALQIVSWIIVYPICKLFVKKGAKKHAGVGALTGLVQGVAVALCICVPLTGLMVQANRIIPMMEDLAGASQGMANVDSKQYLLTEEPGDPSGSAGEEPGAPSGSAGEVVPAEIKEMLAGFENSLIGKFYGETCRPVFTLISEVKVANEDGTSKKITLGGQIDALQAMVDIAKQLMASTEVLQNMDFSQLDSFSDLKDVFSTLDGLKNGLTDEAKATINAVVSAAVDMIPVPEDAPEEIQGFIGSVKDVLKDTDFTDVEFVQELQIVESLGETLQKGEEVTVEDLSSAINSLSESTLILPILEGVSPDLGLDESTKGHIEEVLDQLPESTDAETVDVLKKLLGITTTQPQP